ncbi:HAD family phosphatase [Candidatus Woesearchaeota archaeon]|nr:HAD family phosphatase [Candidatus Woesearchaeota archaeon]
MIKLIIFDIGGILVENYDIPMFDALAKACSKSKNIIEEECTELMQRSERGEITEYEFMEQFLKKMHCKEDPKLILEVRRKATKEMHGTRELIEKIKKHYKVAFATNNAREEFEYNNKVMRFDKLFDWGIASWQAHARKTEPKMFEEILKHFKVKPEETIFIDDSAKNLVAPKALGMQTIQFVSLEQLKDELKKTLSKENTRTDKA